MSKVTIQIDLDNDAFRGDDCGPELARVLEQIARDVKHINRSDLVDHQTTPRDINGNRCGFVSFEVDDDGESEIALLLEDMDDDAIIDALVALGEDVDESVPYTLMVQMLGDHIREGTTTVAKLRDIYFLPY